MKQYYWLAVLALVTALVYFLSNAYVSHLAFKNPETRVVTAVKTVTKTNVVVREKIVRTPDGTETIERVTTDVSVAETAERATEETRIARLPRTVSLGFLLIAPIPDWQSDIRLGVDVQIFGLAVGVAHRVIPFPDALAPSVYLRLSF